MAHRIALGAAPILLAAHAAGQTALFGVRANGDLLKLNPATGAATFVGSSGRPCLAAAPYRVYQRTGHDSYVAIGGGTGQFANEVAPLNWWTGTYSWTFTATGAPAGYGIHGLSLAGPTFALLSTDGPTTSDLLARIDYSNGPYVIVGSTGRTDLESLALSPAGVLYSVATGAAGGLCTIDSTTGVATLVGSLPAEVRSLTFMPDGTLMGCGSDLYSVNPATGAATLIGQTGYSDIRGLAADSRCYVSCDPGHAPPCLNVLDYSCFWNRFAAGDPYANCDESTTPPVLNVLDFMCFLNRFAAGCSEC